jgi:putative Mg2+ transporter-C (MgtC) family protein
MHAPIECPNQRKTLDQYKDLFRTYDMKVVRSVQHKTEHRMSGCWILIDSAENHKKNSPLIYSIIQIFKS